MTEIQPKGLPSNAYTELREGEKYIPIVPADRVIPEMTTRSITIGIIMTIVFSAAAAFLGLKVAQVFEAAIPIAILAVGLSGLFRRKSTILENVIIQSVGAASGLIVAGSIFTLPALFILGLNTDLFQMFLVALFGGCLGILFLIPLRKYFVSEMHGKFPFPEATATTEVLVAGETGGQQAKVLVVSMIIGGIYDFLTLTFKTWSEVFTTASVFGQTLAEKAKLVFKLDVLAAILGLGYIVGLRYSAIICAGSFVSWFVLIPLVYHFGSQLSVSLPPVTDGTLISSMTAEQIFRNYVRLIGIGGIACAGIIGIIKSSKVIFQAFSMGFREIFAGKGRDGKTNVIERTNHDYKMSTILIGIVVLAIVILVFFRFSVLSNLPGANSLSVAALLVVLIISFLFTTVAARAIAIVGTNPVSGMTLMTLILSSVILVNLGLSGAPGMLAALLIGGVVCTALSMAGGFITDLKIGYWIGSTPRNQQRSKLLGSLIAALSVGAVILLLNDVYGFVPDASHPNPLPAPQANAMSAVIQTLMSNQPVPWMLYGIGVLIALVMQMVGIAPLAFALGMYIPLELNVPLLVGGIVAHLVSTRSKKSEVNNKRRERGTLIASGFIAGGAIMGVIGAILQWMQNEKIIWFSLDSGIAEKPLGQYLALVVFAIIVVYMYLDSKRGAKESQVV
jgi:putative OPT family oligopeptide transporter